MSSIIQVSHLCKTFVYAEKKAENGFWKNLISPEKKEVFAVNDISFTVEKGEALGFIGPNGAGKSTTIKMLTGILYPTSGQIRVAGLEPAESRQQLSYRIGCVFGQRSQLVYNLPATDSFWLFGRLYDVPEKTLKNRIDELISLLGLESFLMQPVRKLSLGQRMRAEIACSLIHDPEILFLDEPTIGLDVVAKRKLREVLRTLNKEKGTTLFLTSHDMGDIEALCERTMIINHGKIVVDERTDELKKKYMTTKDIVVDFEHPVAFELPRGTKLLEEKPEQVRFEVNLQETTINAVLKEIMEKYKVADVDVDKPPLESTIGLIYEQQEHATPHA